jgi:hypothetical protein
MNKRPATEVVSAEKLEVQDGPEFGGKLAFFSEQLSRSDRQRPFVESIRKLLPNVVRDNTISKRLPAIIPPSVDT